MKIIDKEIGFNYLDVVYLIGESNIRINSRFVLDIKDNSKIKKEGVESFISSRVLEQKITELD